MKKIALFTVCLLLFFGFNAEASFESWKRGIDEVVVEVENTYGTRMEMAANEHEGVEKEDIYAVLVVESGGKTSAVSSTNVKGLTMLTLNVVDLIRVETGISIDRRHPFEAMWGAGWYLSHLMNRYGMTINEAHAAYYLGPQGLKNELKHKNLGDIYHLKKINYVKEVIQTL